MPVSPTYGVRAQAAALGVQRARVAAPVGFDFGAILAANATHAWWAETLPASGATGNWTDINGVVATATGDPQVGTLNGKRAVVFAGAQWYACPNFAAAIAQPFAIVSVAANADPATSGLCVAGDSSGDVRLRQFIGQINMFNSPSALSGGALPANTSFAVAALNNGASSSIRINGGETTTGTLGTNILAQLHLGTRGPGFNNWTGLIALTAIIAPNALLTDPALQLADVVARAAAVEAGALIEYSIV